MSMKENSHIQTLAPELDVWFKQDEPWNAGYISLMRAIAAKKSEMPPIGRAKLPGQEYFRVGQCAYMAFAPREISAMSMDNGKVNLELFGLGIWGPQGAMPLHFSELAYSRSESYDNTLIDFTNIFHHRALSLLYRAWFLSQDTASLDRKYDERFSFYIGSLIGIDAQELAHSHLPPHARLASSSHLIRESRNPEGIIGALHYYFQIPVRMEEFAEQWIRLDKSDQTILGDGTCAMLLGDGAILGNTVRDCQHKFKLILGPLTLKEYMQFSPWGDDLPVLQEWVKNFVGYEYAWDIQLVLAAEEVPHAMLNGTHQLGYATWLERLDNIEPVSGMSFEPEIYCHT